MQFTKEESGAPRTGERRWQTAKKVRNFDGYGLFDSLMKLFLAIALNGHAQ